MRKYQPIWEQIKIHGKASLLAPASEHLKIIRGVHKERWKDMGHKLLLSEKHLDLMLVPEADTKKGIVTFSLKEIQTISIEDL